MEEGNIDEERRRKVNYSAIIACIIKECTTQSKAKSNRGQEVENRTRKASKV